MPLAMSVETSASTRAQRTHRGRGIMITTRTLLSTTLMLGALLVGVTACGGGGSSSGPITTSPSPTSGSGSSFSFRLDGNQVTATNVTAALTNGILTIAGGNTSSNTTLSFAITPTSAGV